MTRFDTAPSQVLAVAEVVDAGRDEIVELVRRSAPTNDPFDARTHRPPRDAHHLLDRRLAAPPREESDMIVELVGEPRARVGRPGQLLDARLPALAAVNTVHVTAQEEHEAREVEVPPLTRL